MSIPHLTSLIDPLGVIVTPDLDFDLHITQVVKSANAICNTAFRCFIIKDPEFYLTLYRSLVVPKFLYCSEVWRPFLGKHIEAIDRVQSRFIRRVSKRCDVSRDSISLKPIRELQDAADLKMYNRLCSLNVIDRFLDIRPNNLRSEQTVSALEVARTDRVNNMFSWRLARMLRTRPN